MEFLLWLVIFLRILAILLPYILGVGVTLIVMALACPVPAPLALPIFIFVLILVTGFLRYEVFGKERRPPPRYTQHWLGIRNPSRPFRSSQRYRREFYMRPRSGE
jgi:hypothetical protein